jgi:hypothetical protein
MSKRSLILVVAMSLAVLGPAAFAAWLFGSAGWWTVLGLGSLAFGAGQRALHRRPLLRERLYRAMNPSAPRGSSAAQAPGWVIYLPFINGVLWLILGVAYAIR